MAILQIPVRNDSPNYTFNIILEQSVYNLSFRFNTRIETWVMDILDESNSPIIVGIPLLTEQILTDDFVNELKPPGTFLVIDETGKSRNPDRESLGLDHKLFYVESI